MARRKTKTDPSLFYTSLFIEAAKNTIDLSEKTTDKSKYQIDEIVSYKNESYCIIGIDKDNRKVELNSIEFPLIIDTVSFNDFLGNTVTPKSFDEDSCTTVVEEKENIKNYIGGSFVQNGRRYCITSVSENSVCAYSVEFFELFSVKAEQVFPTSVLSEVDMPTDILVPNKIDTSEQATESLATEEVERPLVLNSKQEKLNFKLNDSVEYKTKGERIKANIKAISTLKKIEEEKRLANVEEQSILAEYSGWGGLSEVFDEQKHNSHYEELLKLLDVKEYQSARASVTTAYYTPNFVISSIYDALKHYGFNGGRVLEPALGTGRFFGAMPTEMRGNSSLYACEKDSISARIARQLYQSANISLANFEDMVFEDNLFDLAITNVPYGDFEVFESRYAKYHFSIHNHFIAKISR